MLSHHENIRCMEGMNIVSNDLFTLINHLFTAVLLVVLLFACQEMPESRNIDGIQLEHQDK